MMNLNQTKLVGLTMELDLKAREYKRLCAKLEELEQNNINPNDEKLLELKQLFQKNHNEIVEINRQIKEVKEEEEVKEKQKEEQYNPENLFKKNNRNRIEKNKEENTNKSIAKVKENIFKKIINKIKQILFKK